MDQLVGYDELGSGLETCDVVPGEIRKVIIARKEKAEPRKLQKQRGFRHDSVSTTVVACFLAHHGD
jgi:hypothetical protein